MLSADAFGEMLYDCAAQLLHFFKGTSSAANPRTGDLRVINNHNASILVLYLATLFSQSDSCFGEVRGARKDVHVQDVSDSAAGSIAEDCGSQKYCLVL